MLSMHLESKIIVSKPLNKFPTYLNDPRSLVMWDRSVAKVELTSKGPIKVGSTFDTIGFPRGKKEGLRSSYKITKIEPTQNEVELTSSKLFQKAVWGFSYKAVSNGTEITCTIDLKTRRKYFFMAPLLKTQKEAISTDLEYLKHVIENDQGKQKFE